MKYSWGDFSRMPMANDSYSEQAMALAMACSGPCEKLICQDDTPSEEANAATFPRRRTDGCPAENTISTSVRRMPSTIPVPRAFNTASLAAKRAASFSARVSFSPATRISPAVKHRSTYRSSEVRMANLLMSTMSIPCPRMRMQSEEDKRHGRLRPRRLPLEGYRKREE